MSEVMMDTIFERWRTDMDSSDFSRARAAGDAFERLCIAFLTRDPEQRLQYCNASKFADWAKERGIDATDIGIDLVAELADETGFAAVQCKFHPEGNTIPKAEIDSFLAASGTPDFTRRVIIDTTGRDWSVNLEKMLSAQAIPVVRLGLHNLRASPIDWARFVEHDEIIVDEPPVLRPHQEMAVGKIAEGLAAIGSRGKAIMACGTGKTLTALRAAECLVEQGGRVLYLVSRILSSHQTFSLAPGSLILRQNLLTDARISSADLTHL